MWHISCHMTVISWMVKVRTALIDYKSLSDAGSLSLLWTSQCSNSNLWLLSWLLTFDSWLKIFDSWLLTLDSWLLTLDSWLLTLDSCLLTLDSWIQFFSFLWQGGSNGRTRWFQLSDKVVPIVRQNLAIQAIGTTLSGKYDHSKYVVPILQWFKFSYLL